MSASPGFKPVRRIPEGMVRVTVQQRALQEAPTELLPALPPAPEGPVADVRRSGEYKVSPETEALLKSVRDAAIAETTRDLTIQALTKEVRECATGLERVAGQCTESNRILARIETTQEDHAKQLAAIWDEKKSRSGAWHSFWPTVLGSVLSAVMLAILAVAGVFTPKEVAAPAAPPAPPTVVPKVP